MEAIRADLQQLAEVAARPAALVVGMRADWPAACELLSFRMWAHLQAPCLLCDIRKAELTDPGYCKERALDNPPLKHYGAADYWRDLATHVIEVPIFSENVRATIVAALAFSEASGGRVVRTAIKSLGLQVGDLVHPCADIPDTHALETVSLPALAKFWRGDKTHRLKKASPIMEIPGRTTKLLAVDLLHAWHLGPIQYFVGLGLWHLLESRVLSQSAPAGRAPKEQHALGIRIMRSKLWAYYAERRQTDERFKAHGSQVVPEPRRLGLGARNKNSQNVRRQGGGAL